MDDEILSVHMIAVNNISKSRFEIQLKELTRVSQQSDLVYIRSGSTKVSSISIYQNSVLQ